MEENEGKEGDKEGEEKGGEPFLNEKMGGNEGKPTEFSEEIGTENPLFGLFSFIGEPFRAPEKKEKKEAEFATNDAENMSEKVKKGDESAAFEVTESTKKEDESTEKSQLSEDISSPQQGNNDDEKKTSNEGKQRGREELSEGEEKNKAKKLKVNEAFDEEKGEKVENFPLQEPQEEKDGNTKEEIQKVQEGNLPNVSLTPLSPPIESDTKKVIEELSSFAKLLASFSGSPQNSNFG